MAGCVAGVNPTPAELAVMETTPCSASALPTGAAFYADIQARGYTDTNPHSNQTQALALALTT